MPSSHVTRHQARDQKGYSGRRRDMRELDAHLYHWQALQRNHIPRVPPKQHLVNASEIVERDRES